ncbi:MAG: pyruvate, phosphate dikinase [Bacteroidales bacterium]|nr:pyruvate, phosphate dikinase [Bacteroidales bacterium]
MPENTHLSKRFEQLRAETIERLKELATINQTNKIIKEGKSVEETLQKIALILPNGWQFPEFAVARILYDGVEYRSHDFRKTEWFQQQDFTTIDNRQGAIEVYYTKLFPEEDEGSFLKEERDLLQNLSIIISGYLNGIQGKAFLKQQEGYRQGDRESEKREKAGTSSRQLLQRFLNKNNYDRDIYHDLMPFKVGEILLVANLYDAYSIEKEGRFSEHMLGEYAQLNLTSLPRITGVSSEEEAFEQLESRHFDLVIMMMGADKKSPLRISNRIKKSFPYIPVFLLLNNNSDIFFVEQLDVSLAFDRVFVWNGESSIFFAMIKHVEDRINVENDTRKGLVRVILLVEDSPKYYSRYLPMLYQIVLEQTRRIIDDVSTDDLYKVLKLRARPKILLASSYEEALDIANRYREYLLCLITDVRFSKDGQPDERAGISLVEQIKGMVKDLPVIVQSSDPQVAATAYELKATFIDKDSESLVQDFKSFITHYLGFGNFIYRDANGQQLVVARSLREFEQNLRTIPAESILYHARKNHFSLWLMARGEIQAARILNPKKVHEFNDAEEVRNYLVSVIRKFRNEQNMGKVIPFEKSAILDETNIVSLSEGSLGGKGRGLAFVNNLIYNYDFSAFVSNINIRTPKTSVIGTNEFEYFLERNHLYDFIHSDETDYEELKKLFLRGKLTDTLVKRLKEIVRAIDKPLAIRSSGLFEDSLMQPFAGIFETYLLPNNHPDLNVRLQQLMDAIKLVFASVYSDTARGYIRAVNYKLEEEKMAVVIQEVVGNRYGDVFYPHISGVAQSYNYYPVAHMKPEEGFAVLALGLGKYVVEGEKAFRFSPKYPATEIMTPKDLYKNSQVHFLAVDLNKRDLNLLEGDMAGLTQLDIDAAEMHGTLKHCASVYNSDNHIITPGLDKPGPRVVNFANVLKYNYTPLARTIEVVLDVVKEALGSPVEIEFAVDLHRDRNYKSSFYLLQIKPLLGSAQDYQVDMDQITKDDILLFTEKGMGNGLISSISDVIFVDEKAFDKTKTEEMVREIDMLNKEMINQGRKYILIGPGRWGTRDRWIGIPVNWPQISNAQVIVETSLEGFPLDASSGSHFFHNVTSMNVGYFSVQPEISDSFIDFRKLDNAELIHRTKYFKHVKFGEPLKVRMDGKKRISVITVR